MRPDLIVAVGDDPALQPILSDHAELRVVHPERRPGARRKTEGERRAARRAAFRSYFAEARPLKLAALEAVHFELVEGHLLGLRGVDGRDLAIGVALTNGPRAKLRVLAPAAGIAAAMIVPGAIALNANFETVPLPRDAGSNRAT